MPKFLAGVVLFLLWGYAVAQTDANPGFNGMVEGIIIDSTTQQPLEYTAVSVISLKDSSVAGGMVTDEKGTFRIEKIKPGKYFLRVIYVGYAEKIVNGIFMTPASPVLSLGKIFVAPASKTLGEVDIVQHTEVMEASLDKRVINAEKDLTSVGGTALDLMKNVPSVQVDADNNISLRGNSNVRILIDGRVSTLDPGTMLQQIPASMIKQIEVITNPSAKYDPDGVSGIINIITKKERKKGLNGVATAGLGTGSTKPGGGIENITLNKYNLTTSLNYQTGKWNFFGSFDGRYGMRWNKGRSYTEIPRNDSMIVLDQNNGRTRPVWNYSGKLGFDVNITDRDLWTLGGNIRDERGTSHEVFDYQSSVKDAGFLYHYNRPTDQISSENNYETYTTFKHSFKETGHQIVFDGYYSTTDYKRVNEINENFFNVNGETLVADSIHDQITDQGGRKLMTAQIDYVNPTQKYGRFESGVKYMGRRNSQNITTYTNTGESYMYPDPTRTNAFRYADNIFSAYMIYANTLGKKNSENQLSYQGGLRFEQAFTQSYQVTLNQHYVRNFNNFFPSAHVKYTLKNGADIGASYSRRINRPSYQQLNPFPDYSDRLNLRIGNPYIRPEYISSMELNYGKYGSKLTYSVTLFYRYTTNVFMRLRTIDPYTDVATIIQDNAGQTHSSGIELTYNQGWSKWLRVNSNLSGFYFLQTAVEKYHTQATHNISWTGRTSFNFTLTKTMDLQLTANYRGPQVTPQGTMKPMGGLDFGYKKDFGKTKRASLSFKFTDIFNTWRFSINIDTPGYYSTLRYKWESRMANLTFTYKINQFTERREKTRVESSGDGGGM